MSKLDVLLEEYKAMKAESSQKLSDQTKLIATFVSIMGTIFPIASTLLGRDRDDTFIMLFCFIIPTVSMIIGVIWLDQVYRQIKMAAYISLLEKKINANLNVENSIWGSALYWEQWLRTNCLDRKTFLKSSWLFYYICLGVFSFLPVISFIFGIWGQQNIFYAKHMYLLIILLGYLLFIGFTAKYIRRIRWCNRAATSDYYNVIVEYVKKRDLGEQK